MSYPPFLTGSRVYGSPRETSDYDVVLFLDNKKEKLSDLLLDALLHLNNPHGHKLSRGKSLRIGEFNFILVDSPEEYLAWREATTLMLRFHRSEGTIFNKKKAAQIIDEHYQKRNLPIR